MNSSIPFLFSTAVAAVIFLAGCSDPAESTPDAVVEDVPTEAESAETAAPDDAAPAMESTTYTIAPTSTIGFVGSKVTGSHDGGFKNFSGTVTVPGEDLTQAKIDVTIDMKSTYSDSDGLTKHLLSADFFEVDTYPESTFESTAIAKDGDGYKITGNFTFHGLTKSITFPATMGLEGNTLTAAAEFDINRFDFGVEYPGKADDLIRENVVIKLDITASA
jgi:polyisoprenoid-binding protein YceI